jgi:hypothetical protein
MKNELIERIANFYHLNMEVLIEEATKTDLYSAIAKLTGGSRSTIKREMRGFAYSTGKENSK